MKGWWNVKEWSVKKTRECRKRIAISETENKFSLYDFKQWNEMKRKWNNERQNEII